MKSNNFLNFFKLSLKRSIKPFVIILAMQLIFYIGPILILQRPSTTQVGLIIAALVILCYIVPVVQNSYLMNKKSVDTYYAMPISRRALMNTKLLTGLIVTIVSYTIVYYLGVMIMAIKFPEMLLINYIPLYFITVILGISIYVFNFFIASRANTMADAAFFIILYTFGLWLVILTIMTPLEELNLKWLESFEYESYILFAPFIEVGNYFNDLIISPLKSSLFMSPSPSIPAAVVTVVLGCLGLVGLELLAPKKQAEQAEEISNDIFGYKVLTPMYFLCMIIVFLNPMFSSASIFYVGISIITYLVLNIIRYRKFKLPVKSYIILGGAFITGIIINILLYVTIY